MDLVCTNPDEKVREALSMLILPGMELTITVKTRENQGELEQLAPHMAGYSLEEQPTFYLCFDGRCMHPVNSLTEVMEQIGSIKNKA